MVNIDKVVKDIKSIKIQGATNIAKAAIGALLDFSKSFEASKNFGAPHGESFVFLREAEINANKLAWARPDEPLSQNLLNLIMARLEKDRNKDMKEKVANFQKSCQEALGLISKNEQLITASGISLLKKIYQKKKKPVLVFTHCNSSSVVRILISAHKAGAPLKVYNSETRPLYQGRIMAKALSKAGIKTTMMIDNVAPFVISKNDPDKINIDLVIIGADVVGLDGSVLNKIGSYSLASVAKETGIPFYSAASLLKARKDIDSYRKIKIERRDPKEVWAELNKNVKVLNYAFDTVPPEYISGLITEFGILKSKDVKMAAMKNYKEVFKK
ncbi:MAG: hypothetical protein V1732_04425 [Patescibacteria group bacterium]|nr:hypothetical protein [Patescibacteria group bacterium]MBU4141918.1 hypothetical protein [Patescibacteria group bacterium]